MNIYNLIINFLQSLIIVFFIEKTVSKKRKYSVIFPLLFTIFLTTLITILNKYFVHEGLLGLLFLIIPFLYATLISNDSLVKVAIISFFPYTLIGYISTIVVVILSIFFNQNISIAVSMINGNFLISAFATLLLFIITCLSVNFFKNLDIGIKKSDSIYIFLLIITINFIQMFFESLIFTNKINKLPLFISYLSLIISLLLLFVIVSKMNQNLKELNKQKLDVALLNNRIEHNEEVLQFQQEIYNLKHDMKHLLQLKDCGKGDFPIDGFLTNYSNKIDELPFSYNTNNKVINYVLKIKKEEALLHKIDFTVTTNLVETLPIEDIDLYLLLMNLFDNAIENIGGNKLIKTTISSSNRSLIIKSINSTSPTLPSMAQDIQSKKKETGHGYGLKTMKKIAEKYNGSMIIAQKQDEFVVDIELKI